MKQSHINLVALNALSYVVSRDEARYYLKGVLVEIDSQGITYVATDGHILLAHRETSKDAENGLLGNFIIPIKTCRAFPLPKKKSKEKHLLRRQDDERPFCLEITQSASDYIGFGVIDGTFPDWRKIFSEANPNGKPGTYNPMYLATINKAASVLSGVADIVPELMQDDSGPARVFWSTLMSSYGLIMPMRRLDLQRTLPGWIVPEVVPEKTSEAAE